mgnify:CR=1 FL=1
MKTDDIINKLRETNVKILSLSDLKKLFNIAKDNINSRKEKESRSLIPINLRTDLLSVFFNSVIFISGFLSYIVK